jgi:hypothetical protein
MSISQDFDLKAEIAAIGLISSNRQPKPAIAWSRR